MTDRTRAGAHVIAPIFYAKPAGPSVRLELQPRLASWNARDHPDHVRLAAALTDAADRLQPALEKSLEEPIALRLDVGLGVTIPLLDEHDLDNYAFPLTAHLAASGRRLASVWCTKQHATSSYVRVERAVAAPAPGAAGFRFDLRTDRSASTTAYKQQIFDQLRDAAPLPKGPVSLQVAFTVGVRRNWINLWKPTIDAMEHLMGRSQPERPWHPRDGRIVELGLHHAVDPTLGNDVRIAIIARATDA